MIEYAHIWAWGQFMHSADYYIKEQVQMAKQDHAPSDAIYCRHDEAGNRVWHRYQDVTNTDTRYVMDNLLKAMA